MKIKTVVATSLVAFALLGTGVTAKAAYDWLPGHQNSQAVSDNIDKLVDKIKTLKQSQQIAQQSENDLQNRLNDLQRQKDTEAVNYQQQIQQKIDEINKKSLKTKSKWRTSSLRLTL